MTEPHLPKLPSIAFGGDYFPEQWEQSYWDKDYEAFNLASINTLTVGMFIWSVTQPDEDTYDFTVLDQIIERAATEGRKICLATPSGALPPWMAHEYPDVTRVDFEGRKHVYGQRHNACWSSPNFRRLAAQMATKLAERYGNHPAVVAWHIGNEYGSLCYCELCAQEFRLWLQRKYGTIEQLNEAWNATFWSHRFTDFAQIVPPNALSEHWRGPGHTAFQGITLDYYRFNTDNGIRQFTEEKSAIRAHSDLPATTNFMGFYQPLDYHRWAAHLDFASWDNYPPGVDEPWRTALTHDLMRGLKDGAPFWLMEQTPTVTASRDVNPVRKPGIMRLWSWQAVAHGSDSVLYFQMRQSRGACEMTHGAVLDHSGALDTRAFQEVSGLGAELAAAGDLILGGRTEAKVALLVDWDSWWALEMSDGPNRLLRYLPTVLKWGRAVWELGAAVDVIPVTADFSRYDVVLAPVLHMIKGDTADRLAQVVNRGGSVITGFQSARVDENDCRFLMEVPGPLLETVGVRVMETDSAEPHLANPITLHLPSGREVQTAGRMIFEVLQPRTAQTIGNYGADFYAGTPAVTLRTVPAAAGAPNTSSAPTSGQAWYLGTDLDYEGVAAVVREALESRGLVGPYGEVPGLELARRRNPQGVQIDFLLHHGSEPVSVAAHRSGRDLISGRKITAGEQLTLQPADVLVITAD